VRKWVIELDCERRLILCCGAGRLLHSTFPAHPELLHIQNSCTSRTPATPELLQLLNSCPLQGFRELQGSLLRQVQFRPILADAARQVRATTTFTTEYSGELLNDPTSWKLLR
jgi:hypothetical protein